MTLDEARVAADSPASHLADHNTVHDWFNFFNEDHVVYVETGESVQDAYDGLPDAASGRGGGGLVILGSGGHDVGSGLSLDRNKPASFVSLGNWARHLGVSGATWDATQWPDTTYIYSGSGSPSALVSWSGTSNAYGGSFEGLWFLFDKDDLTYAIDGLNVGQVRVTHCGFVRADTATTVAAAVAIRVYNDSTASSDASWWQIDDIFVNGVAAVQLGDPTYTTNCNRHRVRDVKGFGTGKADTTQAPMVALNGARGCTIDGVNVESVYEGVVLSKPTTGPQCILNEIHSLAGESVKTMVRLDGASSNIIDISGAHDYASGDTLIHFEANCADNFVTLPSVTTSNSLYSKANSVNNEVAHSENWIIAPSNVTSMVRIRLPGLVVESGDPEGSVLGKVGDHYHRLDAAPWWYIKMTGNNTNTGWVAVDFGADDSGGAGYKVLRVPN